MYRPDHVAQTWNTNDELVPVLIYWLTQPQNVSKEAKHESHEMAYCVTWLDSSTTPLGNFKGKQSFQQRSAENKNSLNNGRNKKYVWSNMCINSVLCAKEGILLKKKKKHDKLQK